MSFLENEFYFSKQKPNEVFGQFKFMDDEIRIEVVSRLQDSEKAAEKER